MDPPAGSGGPRSGALGRRSLETHDGDGLGQGLPIPPGGRRGPPIAEWIPERPCSQTHLEPAATHDVDRGSRLGQHGGKAARKAGDVGEQPDREVRAAGRTRRATCRGTAAGRDDPGCRSDRGERSASPTRPTIPFTSAATGSGSIRTPRPTVVGIVTSLSISPPIWSSKPISAERRVRRSTRDVCGGARVECGGCQPKPASP